MSDLELRVSALERDMTALKARVTIVDEDMKNIPNLIKTEFRFTNTQIARLSSEVAELQELRGSVAELQRKVGEIDAKTDAMPRVIAELVTEVLAERDRKSWNWGYCPRRRQRRGLQHPRLFVALAQPAPPV